MDTSVQSLPERILVSYAKFQEAKSDYLEQLIVTPEIVATKIKAVKNNKSPGVGGTQKCLEGLTMMVINNIYKSI